MDFSRFDSASTANEARPVHLTCAATGKKLYENDENPFIDNGKPCQAWVFSEEGSKVRSALQEIDKMRAKAEAGDDTVNMDELHQRMVEIATTAKLSHFENVKKGSEPVTKDEHAWVLNLNKAMIGARHPSFVEQVINGSKDRSLWLGN